MDVLGDDMYFLRIIGKKKKHLLVPRSCARKHAALMFEGSLQGGMAAN